MLPPDRVFPSATKAKAKVAAAMKSESASAKPKTKIDDEKKVDAIKWNAMKMVSTCVNMLKMLVQLLVYLSLWAGSLNPLALHVRSAFWRVFSVYT